jgi:hypothetical protein
MIGSKSAAILCFLLASTAPLCAEENNPAPSASSTTVRSGAPPLEKAIEKEKVQGAAVGEKEEKKTKVSEKEIARYKTSVAGLIAAQARKYGSIGAGSAMATFRINASGRVDHVEIRSSSSQKHAALARKILAGVRADAPPEGPFTLGQKFIFN